MTKVRTFRWLCLFLTLLFLITIVKASAAEYFYVSPGESIQAAVNQAFSGDTIFVRPGVYNESIEINKDDLTIVSESRNPDNTFINSGDRESSVFEITARNVTISGLSVSQGDCGFYLNGVQNCLISNNNISKNEIGICLYNSGNNTLNDNVMYSNTECGIKLLGSSENIIYNNCFNNTKNVIENKPNVWNYTRGNYWSDYTGTDMDGDDIGDTSYVIDHLTNSMDYEPLINFTPQAPLFPEAIFTSNVTFGYAPLTIEFSDFSENANSLSWNFGDLSVSNSSNLLHTFLNEGIYKVTLNVTNENGSDSTNVTIKVLRTPDPSVPVLPEAKFSASVTSGYSPLTVQFVDFSENADSLFWNFGDGKTSSCLTPRHTFCCPGNYTVSLKIKNENGSSSTCTIISVLAPTPTSVPEAKFSASVTSGQAPLTVQFIDLSENAIDWLWDFGDGTQSTEKSPVHTYVTPGNYTVNLRVSNDYGSDLKETIHMIKVGDFNSSQSKDNIYCSQEINNSTYTGSKGNQALKNGEGKGNVEILSKKNLESAESFVLNVAGTPPAELKSTVEHEIITNIEQGKSFLKGSALKTGIKDFLLLIMLVELLGIVFMVSVLRRGKKK